MSQVQPRSLFSTVASNTAVIGGCYLLLVAMVQLSDSFSVRPLPSLIVLVAAVIGLILSSAVQARYAGYLFSAVLAYALPLTLMHVFYGVDSMQGRAPRLALLGAAAIGVILGAWRTAQRPEVK